MHELTNAHPGARSISVCADYAGPSMGSVHAEASRACAAGQPPRPRRRYQGLRRGMGTRQCSRHPQARSGSQVRSPVRQRDSDLPRGACVVSLHVLSLWLAATERRQVTTPKSTSGWYWCVPLCPVRRPQTLGPPYSCLETFCTPAELTAGRHVEHIHTDTSGGGRLPARQRQSGELSCYAGGIARRCASRVCQARLDVLPHLVSSYTL